MRGADVAAAAWRRALAQALGACAAGLLAAAPAIAAVGGSVQPAFPGLGATPLNVGDIKTATITLRNSSSAPNHAESVVVSNIAFTPSCGQDDGNDCLAADAGAFYFTSMSGKTGTACAGIGFSPVADPTRPGRLLLVPQNNAQVVLGPANSPTLNARQCVINANFTVLRVPAIDSTPGSAILSTNSLASATLRGQQTNLTGPAGGGATTPIVGPDLQIGKAPAAPGPMIVAGQQATFTVTLTNAGTGIARQVSLVDPLPGIVGLAWSVASQTPALGCSVQAGPPPTLACPVFDLAPAASATVVLSATTSPGACAQMDNQASASAINNDLDLSGPPTPFPPPLPVVSNPARVSCNAASVDLLIGKTDGKAAVAAAAVTTYTVSVANNGAAPVTGAILADPAAGGLAKTAVACVAGSACVTPPTVAALEAGAVALPSIGAGQSYAIAVSATVTATGGTVKNSASVAPPPGSVNSGASCTAQPEPNSRGFSGGICTAGDRNDVLPTVDLSVALSNGIAVISSAGAAP